MKRRQDLEDELDQEKVKISENTTRINANSIAIAKIVNVLRKEGEHSDSSRVLVTKKRQYTMRAFFGNFIDFQNHFM